MDAKRPLLIDRHNMTGGDVAILEGHLDEYNSGQTGCRDSAWLGFQLMLDNELVGGIAGFTWAGFCELRQFWIHERFRGAGYGSALLNRAIDEARARKCAHVYLATYSFQAPDFYRRFGFEAVAIIENRPPGHRDFIMRLAL